MVIDEWCEWFWGMVWWWGVSSDGVEVGNVMLEEEERGGGSGIGERDLGE
jgi:hypothetical protein